MINLSGGESLFYLGIMIMAVTVAIAVICLICFKISGKRLRKKLELEYGKQSRY